MATQAQKHTATIEQLVRHNLDNCIENRRQFNGSDAAANDDDKIIEVPTYRAATGRHVHVRMVLYFSTRQVRGPKLQLVFSSLSPYRPFPSGTSLTSLPQPSPLPSLHPPTADPFGNPAGRSEGAL